MSIFTVDSSPGLMGNKKNTKQFFLWVTYTLIVDLVYFFAVLYHMFGTAEIKKIDTKSIPFDFSLFQKMVEPTFLETLKIEIDDFMSNLIQHSEGNTLFFFSILPVIHKANLIHFQRQLINASK